MWLEAVKKISPIVTLKNMLNTKTDEATSAADLAKKRIDQEKKSDSKRHDRMLDRARLRDTKSINLKTK